MGDSFLAVSRWLKSSLLRSWQFFAVLCSSAASEVLGAEWLHHRATFCSEATQCPADIHSYFLALIHGSFVISGRFCVLSHEATPISAHIVKLESSVSESGGTEDEMPSCKLRVQDQGHVATVAIRLQTLSGYSRQRIDWDMEGVELYGASHPAVPCIHKHSLGSVE